MPCRRPLGGWALLFAPIPVLFWLTLGLYTVVGMVALLGGLAYAVLGAVRALRGDERAYPGNWPARARPLPVATDPSQREGRAQWALAVVALVIVVEVVLRAAT